MNETICTIMKRGSLRRYKEENISDEHLDIILNAAMRAPTAGNMMTYSVITVRKEETKKKLAISCDNQPFIAKAPLIARKKGRHNMPAFSKKYHNQSAFPYFFIFTNCVY